jgi:hypothetical protein
MIYRTKLGKSLRHICLEEKVVGVESPKITAGLSMRFSGSCVPVLHGETFPRTLEDGATPTVVLFGGETGDMGKTPGNFDR